MSTRRSWIAFAVTAACVLLALLVVTVQSLRLESREVRSRAVAEHEGLVRLVLWRMDSMLAPILAREAATPAAYYRPFHERGSARLDDTLGRDEADALARKGLTLPAVAAPSPSPLLRGNLPLVNLYFEERDGVLSSPQVPVGVERALAESEFVSAYEIEVGAARLRELGTLLMTRTPGEPARTAAGLGVWPNAREAAPAEGQVMGAVPASAGGVETAAAIGRGGGAVAAGAGGGVVEMAPLAGVEPRVSGGGQGAVGAPAVPGAPAELPAPASAAQTASVAPSASPGGQVAPSEPSAGGEGGDYSTRAQVVQRARLTQLEADNRRRTWSRAESEARTEGEARPDGDESPDSDALAGAANAAANSATNEAGAATNDAGVQETAGVLAAAAPVAADAAGGKGGEELARGTGEPPPGDGAVRATERATEGTTERATRSAGGSATGGPRAETMGATRDYGAGGAAPGNAAVGFGGVDGGLAMSGSGPARAAAEMLTPVWFVGGAAAGGAGGDAQAELVLVRRALVDGEVVTQGLWLNWAELSGALLELSADVFPTARLRPLPAGVGGLGPTELARCLATIPAELVVPEPVIPAVAMVTPVRAALGLAWIVGAGAIVASGLALRSAMELAERRGRFVSAVTHELRTPLTTFCLYSQMLADGMVKDEASRAEYHGTLQRESQRLSRIVESVLEYARLGGRGGSGRGGSGRGGSGRGVASVAGAGARPDEAAAVGTSVDAALDAIVPGLRDRAGLAGLEIVERREGWGEGSDAADESSASGVPRVGVDVATLERIVSNLVDNASKYAAGSEPARIDVTARVVGERLEIVVRDYGPGVAREDAKRIFDPFVRGAAHADGAIAGMGLGLALCRTLARDAGGSLVLGATAGGNGGSVGRGASFVVTLPLVRG
jgi:signal transduction histidine kinase